MRAAGRECAPTKRTSAATGRVFKTLHFASGRKLGIALRGLHVSTVVASTQADRAGVKLGWVVVAVQGVPVWTQRGAETAVAAAQRLDRGVTIVFDTGGSQNFNKPDDDDDKAAAPGTAVQPRDSVAGPSLGFEKPSAVRLNIHLTLDDAGERLCKIARARAGIGTGDSSNIPHLALYIAWFRRDAVEAAARAAIEALSRRMPLKVRVNAISNGSNRMLFLETSHSSEIRRMRADVIRATHKFESKDPLFRGSGRDDPLSRLHLFFPRIAIGPEAARNGIARALRSIVQEPLRLLTVAVAFDGARGVVKRGSHVLMQTTPRVLPDAQAPPKERIDADKDSNEIDADEIPRGVTEATSETQLKAFAVRISLR